MKTIVLIISLFWSTQAEAATFDSSIFTQENLSELVTTDPSDSLNIHKPADETINQEIKDVKIKAEITYLPRTLEKPNEYKISYKIGFTYPDKKVLNVKGTITDTSYKKAQKQVLYIMKEFVE